MPNLFDFDGYTVFFWSNENNEPIYVHATTGNPHGNSTKIWLTKGGGCFVANNKSRISEKDLKKYIKVDKEPLLLYCFKMERVLWSRRC